MSADALDEDALSALDRFIAHQDRPPLKRMTRNEAVLVIVRDWLMGQGYLPMVGDDAGITPAAEAAGVPKD